MPPTLLADLALLLAKSPEDVATEALNLILAKSPVARCALNKTLRELVGTDCMPVENWTTQAAGADNARPDMEGRDETGELQVILENKFWAGLTPNQPITYLDRLPPSAGIVAFVVPEARLDILTIEIAHRLSHIDHSIRRVGKAQCWELKSGRRVALTSWTVLLDAVQVALDAAGDYDTRADTNQLYELCARMERTGFRPFTATDITGSTPLIELQCCELVDRLVERLLAQQPPIADKRGLRAQGSKAWYGHYVKIHGFGCQIAYTAWKWAQRGASPIWLCVSTGEWSFPVNMKQHLSRAAVFPELVEEVPTSAYPGVWLPIRILEGREQGAVLDDMQHQIARIAEVLNVRKVESDTAAETHSAVVSLPGVQSRPLSIP